MHQDNAYINVGNGTLPRERLQIGLKVFDLDQCSKLANGLWN